MGVSVRVVKPFEEIYVDGKRLIVKEIVEVTPTHIVVRRLDDTIEAIPIERVTSPESLKTRITGRVLAVPA
ncbi:MAG: hypothetical protein QXM08_07610 [Thermofilaceae archaeon]